MKIYTIKSETADLIRQAAPALGLVANGAREIVGPGLEAVHLDPFAAVKFESLIRSHIV